MLGLVVGLGFATSTFGGPPVSTGTSWRINGRPSGWGWTRRRTSGWHLVRGPRAGRRARRAPGPGRAGRPPNATARGLLGLVDVRRPVAAAPSVAGRGRRAARLAEYNGRRAGPPETAKAQWELALWCEQKGLKPEALAHFTAVTRLDPEHAAAWKRLGCRKAAAAG